MDSSKGSGLRGHAPGSTTNGFLRTGRNDRGPEWSGGFSNWSESAGNSAGSGRRKGARARVRHRSVDGGARAARGGITAVDASPEVLDINRARLQETEVPVRYVRADLFDWRPEEAYDVAFFGFWLSHVPPGRFAAFWDLVRAALRPSGRAFFVDSLRTETWAEKESAGRAPRDHDAQTTQRRAGVQDRQDLLTVKLEARLADMGWRFSVRTTDRHLLYGFGEPRRERALSTPQN